MRKNFALIPVLLCLAAPARPVCASGASNSAAKNMLQAPTASAAAMGEAMSGAPDDISGFAYNPALLSTMQSRQLSLMYHDGLVDDYYNHFSIAVPHQGTTYGLSFGLYNGGKIDVSDGFGHSETITAQKDYLASFGAARKFGAVNVGATFKYFASEVGERSQGSAVAADFGTSYAFHPRFHAGAALQNFGSSIQYENASESLPKMARAGFSWIFLPNKYKPTFNFELPYDLNAQELRMAWGLQTSVGPIALRGGYQSHLNLHEFTAGAGFNFNQFTLDYSYGFVQNLDAAQRVSLIMHFANKSSADLTALTDEETAAQVEASDPALVASAQSDIEDIQRRIQSMEFPPILFEFDSAKLKEGSKPTLDRVAKIIRKYPTLNLEIQGHTDSIGQEKYNTRLSYKRAFRVRAYLAKKANVDIGRIHAMGKGDRQPVSDNATAQGRQTNRRVEFKFR